MQLYSRLERVARACVRVCVRARTVYYNIVPPEACKDQAEMRLHIDDVTCIAELNIDLVRQQKHKPGEPEHNIRSVYT